jgi:methylated-DNA-[protein]-cysteine S-methyltransferase
MDYYSKTINSPVGKLKLFASNEALVGILWEREKPSRAHIESYTEKSDHPILVETEKQLNEYFNGERKQFDIKLDFIGTDFQKQVWQALLTIPFGETRSYGQIAAQLNNPKSVRAVGAANGKNPISIIAPCHRVIGMDGSLTGFAGGIENKEILLKLENSKLNFNKNTQLDIFESC